MTGSVEDDQMNLYRNIFVVQNALRGYIFKSVY